MKGSNEEVPVLTGVDCGSGSDDALWGGVVGVAMMSQSCCDSCRSSMVYTSTTSFGPDQLSHRPMTISSCWEQSWGLTWYQGACYRNFIQQYKRHFVIYQVVLFYCNYHNIQLDVSSSLLYMTLVKMGENSTLSTKDHVRGPGRHMIGNEPAGGQCTQGRRGTAAKAWRG